MELSDGPAAQFSEVDCHGANKPWCIDFSDREEIRVLMDLRDLIQHENVVTKTSQGLIPANYIYICVCVRV